MQEKIDRKIYVKIYNTLYYEKNKAQILEQKKEARKLLAESKKPKFKIINEIKTLTFNL